MKEQLKKLSDLKENEYVYCETEKETKRILNTEIVYRFCDNKGKSCLLEHIAKNGTFIVHNSKDIADYEPPVPVRPNRRQIVLTNVRGVCDVIDAKAWNQLNDYTDHLEKELEEVKSKAFIPFKVKVDFNFAGLSAELIYVAHYEHSDCYFIEKPNGKMDYIHKSYCKKIS